MKLHPSAGMIWAEPRSVVVAARDLVVEEIRVLDAAAIETAFAELAGHPYKGYEDSLAVMANKAAHSREEVIHHGMRMMDARAWPPRLGSQRFREILSTPEGGTAFYWIVLRRSNPSLAEPEFAAILEAADPAELDAVDRIAWGYQPWEDMGDVGSDDESGSDGIPWGQLVSKWFALGHSHESIARMTLTQFFNVAAEGEPRRVRLRPLAHH